MGGIWKRSIGSAVLLYGGAGTSASTLVLHPATTGKQPIVDWFELSGAAGIALQFYDGVTAITPLFYVPESGVLSWMEPIGPWSAVKASGSAGGLSVWPNGTQLGCRVECPSGVPNWNLKIRVGLAQ